jgi:hypothetical protein
MVGKYKRFGRGYKKTGIVCGEISLPGTIAHF